MKELLRFIEMWLMATSAVIFCKTDSDLFILPMAVANVICWAIAINDERGD